MLWDATSRGRLKAEQLDEEAVGKSRFETLRLLEDCVEDTGQAQAALQ